MGTSLTFSSQSSSENQDEVHPDGGFRVRCSPVPVAGGLHAG